MCVCRSMMRTIVLMIFVQIMAFASPAQACHRIVKAISFQRGTDTAITAAHGVLSRFVHAQFVRDFADVLDKQSSADLSLELLQQFAVLLQALDDQRDTQTLPEAYKPLAKKLKVVCRRYGINLSIASLQKYSTDGLPATARSQAKSLLLELANIDEGLAKVTPGAGGHAMMGDLFHAGYQDLDVDKMTYHKINKMRVKISGLDRHGRYMTFFAVKSHQRWELAVYIREAHAETTTH